MQFNKRNWECHSEHREESPLPQKDSSLRSERQLNTDLFVNVHYRTHCGTLSGGQVIIGPPIDR